MAAGRAALRRLGAGPARPRRSSRPPRRDGFHVLHKETATQQYVLQLAAGPAAEDPDRYAAKLLATVLGDDSGSRLYWELVDPGLAEHVSLSHGEHQGAGMMMTYMSCDPEHAADNLHRILDVYRRAEAEGVTAGGTRAGQEQGPLADRAFQRAAPRPAVRRRQRLGLPPRVSAHRARAGRGFRRHGRRPVGRAGEISAHPRYHGDHRPAGGVAAAGITSMTQTRVDPLSPLLLSVLFLALASLFVCCCGFLMWEALFGTMPAVIFAWRGLLRANALLARRQRQYTWPR